MAPHASLKRINENNPKLAQELKVSRKYTNCERTRLPELVKGTKYNEKKKTLTPVPLLLLQSSRS